MAKTKSSGRAISLPDLAFRAIVPTLIAAAPPAPIGGHVHDVSIHYAVGTRTVAVKSLNSGYTMAHQPEILGFVRRRGDTSLDVRFADGVAGAVELPAMGLDPLELDIGSARMSPDRTAVQITGHDGEVFSIDSSAIRAELDPEYAQRLEKAAADLSLPKASLERFVQTHRPPQSWFDEDELPF